MMVLGSVNCRSALTCLPGRNEWLCLSRPGAHYRLQHVVNWGIYHPGPPAAPFTTLSGLLTTLHSLEIQASQRLRTRWSIEVV